MTGMGGTCTRRTNRPQLNVNRCRLFHSAGGDVFGFEAPFVSTGPVGAGPESNSGARI
jgi:hypothetical protein